VRGAGRHVSWTLLAGVLLLALAAWVAPTPPRAEAGLLGALGRSLGGARVALLDVLFLRAEALRARGEVEEVPGLYRAVLELDPGNVQAIGFLADVYAFDLLPEAPDATARLAWWRRAWETVEAALADHPHDPTLLLRSSDLLFLAPALHPELLDGIERIVPDADLVNARRLAEAARLRADLPRRGRTHLVRLALALPMAAAVRLRDGREGVAEILALGGGVLDLRRADLAEVLAPPLEDGREDPRGTLDRVLAAGLDAVGAVRERLLAGDRSGAREAADALERAVPGDALAGVLRAAAR
jgi:hypothetical protein